MTIELQAVQPELTQLELAPPASLYETDFLAWIETTAVQLRAKNFAAIDWENLLEEIDAMGRRERRSLESNLVILLMHLLKWQYQPEQRSGSWKGSIREHRRRIRKDLQDSPSLQPYFRKIIATTHLDAVAAAADETGLALSEFPRECLYSVEQLLDPEFLPA
jgi:Domain of unknown function DUF29